MWEETVVPQCNTMGLEPGASFEDMGKQNTVPVYSSNLKHIRNTVCHDRHMAYDLEDDLTPESQQFYTRP